MVADPTAIYVKTEEVKMSIGKFRQRLQLISALALLMPLLATQVAPLASAQDEAGPLRIAALFPFTGDLSDFGPPFITVAEFAASEINDGGGVNGQPIEIVQGDTATSPTQAVEEARRLIEIEGVAAIVGPAGSGETLPVVESVAGPSGVLVISPSATSPALTIANDSDFFFRTTIHDSAQGPVMADLAREQGIQSVCIFYLNNQYGQGLAEAFAERFTSEGGEVTVQVPHEQEQASYASELATCTEAGPDAVVAISYPESGRVFLRELVEAGDAPSLVLSDGLKSPGLFEDLGWDNFDGAYGTAPASVETETGARLDEEFEAEFGQSPVYPYLRQVYDAVYLIALAAEQADSVDSTAIRDALREVASEPGTAVEPGTEGWQAAVAAITAGDDINYEGAGGPAEFDENGDIARGLIEIWKVEGGELVTEETREYDITAAAAES
jgi:ABC-type branched-subunit amino acid transport system substrate-binding protein